MTYKQFLNLCALCDVSCGNSFKSAIYRAKTLFALLSTIFIFIMKSVTLASAEDKNTVRKAVPTSVNHLFALLKSVQPTHAFPFRKFSRLASQGYMLLVPILPSGHILKFGERLRFVLTRRKTILSLYDSLTWR